jgi:hypothetical protein
MVTDKRYTVVKKLILANALGSFSEIFDTLPKTVLARDLGMHHQTLTGYLANPLNFSFENAFDIADLIGVDPLAIVTLIGKEIIAGKKGKKRG